jgi:hypothetical protein
MACMGRRSLPLRNRSALCAISSGTRGPWNFANTQSMQCLYLERSCSYLYRSCALEIAAKTVFYLQTLTSRFRKSGWRADLLPQLNKINGCSKFSGSKSPAETPANPPQVLHLATHALQGAARACLCDRWLTLSGPQGHRRQFHCADPAQRRAGHSHRSYGSNGSRSSMKYNLMARVAVLPMWLAERAQCQISQKSCS